MTCTGAADSVLSTASFALPLCCLGQRLSSPVLFAPGSQSGHPDWHESGFSRIRAHSRASPAAVCSLQGQGIAQTQDYELREET